MYVYVCIMFVIFKYNYIYFRSGPLSHLWCLRFEAKHQHFKRVAKVVGNFTNIAKTLAYRHQRYMCYKLSNPKCYLKDFIEFGPCQ